MIYIDLILNLSFMVSSTIISGFIDKCRGRETLSGLLMQGMLFGTISVLGMVNMLISYPDMRFGGQSLMISVCALFFGQWPTTIACIIAIVCRIWIGGAAVVTGVLIIILSAVAGLVARYYLKPDSEPLTVRNLFIFGLAVHLAMLAVMLMLPGEDRWNAVRVIWLPVILVYPVATILAGKILSERMSTLRIITDIKEAKHTLKTTQDHAQKVMKVRLNLLEYATNHTLGELLTRALDETGELVGSPIGFYHFVDADQQTLSLQQWSSRTLKEFCKANGNGLHYKIENAGVWVDCVHKKRPVIHNDYASLSHKKGMPEGHANLVRELVVPIMREGRVVAILGVGNKSSDYTQNDVETVSYLADVTWLIVETKKQEEALQQSEMKYRNLFENAPIGIFTSTSNGDALSVNSAMASMLGFASTQEAIAYYHDVKTDLYVDPDKRVELLEELEEKGRVKNFEYQAYKVDRTKIWISMTARVAEKKSDGSFIIEGFAMDITDHKKIEEQFLQAQKMESVGRLAGGVAHDYNNMLSVILGYTELALQEVSPSDHLHDKLQQILKAANRSADVTKQLLAFARKQTIAPKIVDINESVEGMLKMIRRLIGEDIDLVWLPAKTSIWPIKIDPSQLDQIMANLCVNARDAIDGVGRITIETGMVQFDKAYCNKHTGFIPGDFVVLVVSDNGSGMDKDTMKKLFEPFFTTKQIGRGTGLGLATIYGIIKQNNGFINAYSEPGKGTTFRVYLPRNHSDLVDTVETGIDALQTGNGETVLVVEDETAILDMAKDMLENLGYSVLAAATPDEATALAHEHHKDIKLLLTDVVMPEMNGRELARQLINLNPDLKVIFMSGYTANVIAHHGVLDNGVLFIQKPFSMKDLAAKVHQSLEQQQEKI
ncbi:MAG: GAF domain-containing protein [Desulfamplus sp.]|nr:GAF domain-containing protein [Desulfamplus sp.]